MASEAAALKSAWQQTADIATRYKAAENATRPFAALMVKLASHLATLNTTPISIFDLGCGTGAVEAEIYHTAKKEDWKDLNILAGDVSPPMLAYLAQRGEECGWDTLTTRIVDGSKLGESGVGEGFGRVFVGFAIFVLPPGTIKLLGQKVAQGGTLAISTWARLPWFEVLEKTLERLEDGPAMPTEEQIWKGMTNGQPWHDAGFVKEQLESAGLKKVEVVQRKENVDCGTPELFMTTMGFVLGLLSAQWPEEKRAGWLKDVGDTMKAILIEKLDRPDDHVFMEFEGIVGVGLKE
jgi:SAM-dependent methyltransferase